MSALPADIAAALRPAVTERFENLAVRDAFPAAKDGSLTPAEGFFDLLSDARTIANERGALLNGGRRFTAEIHDELWLDPSRATPSVRLVDAEQAVDGVLCCARIELDLEAEVTRLELFTGAAVSALAPPAAALRIAPGGAGNRSGDSWENAAPITSLRAMVVAAAAIGGQVWVRADAGPYILPTSPIILTSGGAAALPVVVRGAAEDGTPMHAELIGTRATPWTVGQARGQEAIWLNAGADHLRLEHLHFRNVGVGIRARMSISNLSVADIEADNVAKLFQNYRGTGVASATISGLTIRRMFGRAISQNLILLRSDTHNVLVEDCDADMGNIDGDFIAIAYQMDDTAHEVVFRRCKARNIYQTGPGSYWNGDGFTFERGNYDILVENCEATDSTDSGIDTKALNVRLVNFKATRCKRPVRNWGTMRVTNPDLSDPVRLGGTGSTALIIAMDHGKSRTIVEGGTYRIPAGSATVPFRVLETGFLAVDQEAQNGVTKPAGVAMFATEGTDDFAYGTWDHADATPPVITSPLGFSVPENAPFTFLVEADKPVTLEMDGPDRDKFTISGRRIIMATQDYDKADGPAADGTKVLKARVRARDANDNLSLWYNLTIEITDVSDDPITPAQAIAASGATDGFWYDLSQRGSIWADAERTIRAEPGDLVKRIDDLSGFGKHASFEDGAEPVLRIVAGAACLELNGGGTFGRIGQPGDLRFPQFTAFAAVQRDRDDSEGSSYILFSGRRSTTATSSSNGSFWMGARDTSYAVYRTNGTNGGIDDGAPRNRPFILSYRTADGVMRSNAALTNNNPVPVAANGYSLAAEQPLLGCRFDGTNRVGFFSGLFFGAAMLNRDLADDVRFRVERQLVGPTGLNL